jgi:hypothetical protein
LNWLGGYSSVAKSMYNGGRVPQAISPLARQVTDSVFNPPDPEWTRSRGIGNEPASWGNKSLYPGIDDIEAFLVSRGLGTPLWTYGNREPEVHDDFFYVFTVNQVEALAPYRK